MSEITKLSIEDYQIPEQEREMVVDKSGGSQKFGFIGIGHCGSKIVQEFYKLGYMKSIVLNTASADLGPIEISRKQKFFMDIGQEGAAKDIRRGAEAIKRYEHDIYDLIHRYIGSVDRIIICIGAGGGTGGGGIIRTIRIVKKYFDFSGINGKISVLATLPDDGELQSKVVVQNAYICLQSIIENKDVTSIMVVDNNRIKLLYPNVPVKEHWRIVNSSIAGLFHIFNILSAQSSPYQNFDPSDYESILNAKGFMIMGMTAVREYNDKELLATQMRDNVKKTLWAVGFDLSSAQVAGVIAVAGVKIFTDLSQDVLNYGMDAIGRLTGGAVVHRGVYEDNRDVLRIYTIIGGLKPPDLVIKLKNMLNGNVDLSYMEAISE